MHNYMGIDTGSKMLSPDDLGPADVELLELLEEGRVTAPYAAEETGYSLQYVRDRLARFVEHDNVEKVYEGLYELRADPREGGSHVQVSGSSDVGEQSPETPGGGSASDDQIEPVPESPPDGERENAEGILVGTLPANSDRQLKARVEGVLKMYDRLRQQPGKPVSKSDLLATIDPEGDFGYASKESVWSNAIKANQSQNRPNSLTALPGVEEGVSQGTYVYTGAGND